MAVAAVAWGWAVGQYPVHADWSHPTFLLLLLIVVLALAGGFLGEVLEVAFVIVVVLAAVGALIRFLLWRAVRGLLD